MTWTILFMFIVLSAVYLNNGKTFSQCELSKELIRQGFPRNEIRDWVCLVEAESSRRTGDVGGPDEDGSYDYGLFQINDRYWCNAGDSPGKECNLRCRDLLTDDITAASVCSKQIFVIHGFFAWVGWVNECRGRNLPDLSQCGIY